MSIVDDILRREGSAFTDHPADRGGPTRYGITQTAWQDYRARHPGRTLVEHVRDLNEATAREFYQVEYVGPFAWLSADLRALVVDCAVNHGKRRAILWLQEAADVDADGVIGPQTRAAVIARTSTVYRRVLSLRLQFYATIVARDTSQAVFLRGWINRACEFVR